MVVGHRSVFVGNPPVFVGRPSGFVGHRVVFVGHPAVFVGYWLVSVSRPSVRVVSGIAAALIGVGASLTVLTLVWMVSLKLRDASIADVCWGLGFVLQAWLYRLLSPAAATRSWLVVALVTVWGARLSLHIFRRNRRKGEDRRYQALRDSRPQSFWWRSLFTVFWLQAALLWLVGLPMLVAVRAAAPAALSAADGVGILLFAIGFGFEAVGDYQLARFKADPANRGKVLDTGLWRYTRHPNYFGDSTVWWGIYAMAAATPGGWLTLVSPSLMTLLLLRVSGVTLLEENLKSSKPGYGAYITRTPAFFPWFPRAPQ
jgi:steroid 5-alpha reductase family enzyme